MTDVLKEKGTAHRGEHLVKIEPELGVIHLQAKKCQLLAATRK